ncbi:type II toxin-antitoxin system ParD family antitoxin [Phenylobacterium sp.]|uniref:ribbon-helix-helix domain-containing protein n=1 Tax=Phenylobacterium sp. TaxID=1871053 RepID=UPI0035B4229C
MDRILSSLAAENDIAPVHIIPYFVDMVERPNPRAMTLNVRISGALGDFVAANVGDEGAYENVSEYVRDLIRQDKARSESQAFDRLKAELQRAFAAPESSYHTLDADTVLARGRQRAAE